MRGDGRPWSRQERSLSFVESGIVIDSCRKGGLMA